MEELRVLVVGESLFAESLHHLLSEEEQHINVERVANFALAQPALQNKLPHVLILVDLDMSDPQLSTSLDENWPDIPVIWANIKNDYLRIIPSRRIRPSRIELIQAINYLVTTR